MDLTWDWGIYTTVAWGATILFLLLTLLTIFGIGGDDMDVGDADGDAGGGVFSIRTISGFLLGFGWGGVMAEEMGWSSMACAFSAIGLGLIIFFIIAVIMKTIAGLKSDGTLKYETLVGMTANVYLTIPPQGKSGGQVKVPHPSQLLYLPAVQKGDEPLPTNTPVKITEVNSGVLTVEKI